jgi:ion channel-forming bestrophin family protein
MRSGRCFFVACVFMAVLAVEQASAFTPQDVRQIPSRRLYHHRMPSTTALKISSLPKEDSSGLSYGERSRPFRRDVFAYDDWVQHRTSERFLGNLFNSYKSGVVQQLLKEVYLSAGIATFICIYNALLVNGYDDFLGVHHDPLVQGFYVFAIPSVFFALTSPALSLLLVFKTNVSYQRWDEGRKNWGAIVNNSRTIMREGAAWIHQADIPSEEKQRLLCRLAAAVWCFPRSMTRHLLGSVEDEEDYVADCRANLRPELAEDLIAARHRPSRALYELSCAINEFPLSDWRRIAVDTAATALCDAMGSNERIFSSPVPRSYTRHTARFLEVWLLLMPLTLYDAYAESWNHWGMIPATVVISFFLTGIEELGLQLEEPFSLLCVLCVWFLGFL